MELKLPGRVHKKDKMSKAEDMYGRSGRLDYGEKEPVTLPVTMDPDAMEQLVKELAMRQHGEQLQSQMNQMNQQPMLPQTQLPGPQY